MEPSGRVKRIEVVAASGCCQRTRTTVCSPSTSSSTAFAAPAPVSVSALGVAVSVAAVSAWPESASGGVQARVQNHMPPPYKRRVRDVSVRGDPGARG